MQRNSNQQSSHSVSIRSKREQLRTQIRREQLQQYFRKKRIEYFSQKKQGEQDIFYKSLYQQIQYCPNDNQAIQNMLKKVNQVFSKFPTSFWNFFIVGGFLFKFPFKLSEIEHLIFREQNLAFHSRNQFAWCLGIYISTVCNSQEPKYNGQITSKIEKIDIFLGMLTKKYFEHFQINQQTISTMTNYMLCMPLILNASQNYQFFPINSFNQIIANLFQFYIVISIQKKYYTRELKLQITKFLNESIFSIKNKELYSQQAGQFASKDTKHLFVGSYQMDMLMKCSAQVFYENIKDASDERQNCLQSMKILCNCNPIPAGQYLFTQKIIEQFIFLMKNHTPQTRVIILQCFDSVLPSLRNTKLCDFLQFSLHINLAIILKQCLINYQTNKDVVEQKYSDPLFYTLKVIEMLLYKVSIYDQSKKILNNVLHQMELQNFGDYIEKMGNRRYDDQIEKIEFNLIDLYFSQDKCWQNCENNENCGDYMNVNHNTSNNEKKSRNKMSYSDQQFII